MRWNSPRAVGITSFLSLASAAGLAACSLINSYDPLAPARASDASTIDQEAPPDSATGVDQTSGDANGRETSVQATPSPGVIVLGGAASSDAGDTPVLTALDPRTGREFPPARVPMQVHAVEYESARDYWYVLESGGDGVYPLPGDPFFLHVRQLDRTTGAWTELAKVSLPAGVSSLTTTVVGTTLAYVAYGAGGDGGVTPGGSGPVNGSDPTAALAPNFQAPYGLVAVDTSDLAAITACVLPLPSGAPNGVIGTPNGTSGSIASLGNYPSNGFMTPVVVPPSGCDSLAHPPTAEPQYKLPTGNTAFSLVTNGSIGQVMVASKGFGPGPAMLTIYDPASGEIQAQASFTSGYTDGNIKAPAYSECLGQTIVTGTNTGTSIWVLPFGPGTIGPDGGPAVVTSAPQGFKHSGQGVYYEPFTNTILLPFSQGDFFELTAFRFIGGGFKYITKTSLWQPPPDLRPDFIAVRAPSPFPCVQADE
jgi:hypothetical protein